uniref:Uncharacterized protein n=1 Tax=Fusarium oxysporum (strain Fo5176) TaxID=660025 RepID=A0A0D2XFC5_FUSOF
MARIFLNCCWKRDTKFMAWYDRLLPDAKL